MLDNLNPLIGRVFKSVKKNRDNILSGYINSIPPPFKRFSHDFIGFEEATYYLITSFTKAGKSQLAYYLIWEALWYLYHNPNKGKSLKVLVFPLEETDVKVTTRLISWLLHKYTCEEIRISPKDLMSADNEKPVPENVLAIMEDDGFLDILNYFLDHMIFSTESNPTGIYKECIKYAVDNGKVITTKVTKTNDFGQKVEIDKFDHYEKNDPNEIVIPLVDTFNLLDSERGYTKKQCIDKMSEYCIILRNNYYMSPLGIQQQNTSNESIENFKFSKIRPSTSGLGDSTNPARDANITLSIFSPFKFGLKDYLGYSIDKLKDHFRTLEVLTNRDGELGGIVPLYFDGAICNWKELPYVTDTAAMSRMYNKVGNLFFSVGYRCKKSFFEKMKDKFNKIIRYIQKHLIISVLYLYNTINKVKRKKKE